MPLDPSQELLLPLLNASPVPMLVSELEGGAVVAVNNRLEELFQTRSEAILGRTTTELGFWQDLHQRELFLASFRSGGEGRLETIVQRPDGSARTCIVCARLLEHATDPALVVSTILDITEVQASSQRRREAEDAQRLAEERLNQILENSYDGLWDFHVATGEVYFSPRYYRILGFEPNEFTPSFALWKSMLHPDDLAPAEAVLRRHFQDPSVPYLVEFRMRQKDGSWIWIEAHGKVVERGPDGAPLRMVGTHTDISARKLAQEDSLRSRQRLEHIVRSLAEGVITLDGTGSVLEANSRAHEILKVPDGVLQGVNMVSGGWTFLQPDGSTLPPEQQPGWLTLQDGKTRRDVEVGVNAMDGSIVWISVSTSILERTPEGRPALLLVSFSDITGRKTQKETLLAQEERLREVADMSQDMLSRHDMSGVCLWASPACRHILGVEPDAVVGRSAFGFIVEEDRSPVQAALGLLVQQGTSRLQYRIRRTDGSILWSETIWSLTRDASGKPLEIHCSTRDIGERKRQSDLLRTSQRIARLGGWETDVATGATSWTEELFRIHEIDDNAIDTSNIRSMLPYLGDGSREAMLEAHRRLLADGTPWSLVLHGVTTKGNPLVIRSTCEGVFEDGKLRTLRGTTQDITQQEHLRQQLEAVSRLNASILSTTEALIILLDREGRIVRFNHACERLTGWLESEMLGKPFFEILIPENERTAVGEVFHALSKGMFPNHFENHWTTRSGSLLWISWANSVLLDHSGAIQYVLGTGIDMTAHRATQLELLDSQEKWRVLIESAPEAIVILDIRQGRFLDVNPAAEAFFGLPKSALVELGPIEVSPPRQPDGTPSDLASRDWISKASAGGPVTFEWMHRHADGHGILCLINLSPLPPDSQGRPLLRASMVDITERRKTESVIEALVRGTSSHFGQAFFDALVKDLAQLLEVQYAYIARIEGGEVRTLSFFADRNLAVPLCFPLHGSPCQQVFESGPLFAPDRVRERFPSNRVLEELEAESYMGVPLLNAAQQPIGVLAVLHSQPMPESDLARAILTIFAARAQGEVERLEAEQALRRLNIELEHRVHERTAELQASNRELESFSYSVSHDLRSPLRSVDGFAQALLEDYGPLLDQVAVDYIERIRSASHRMADLIDDLLSLSRSSRTTLHKTHLDLSATAREILDGLRETDPERLAEIDIEPDLYTFGDSVLMRSVLENLLGNAWKYSRHKNPARIRFLSEEAPPGFAGFAISDNGAGFDMAHANRLFRTFQRLHGAEEFEGNGIGLATVRRILERHGGSITGEGIIGNGATFHFRLPLGTLPDADRDPPSPLPRD